MNPAALYFVPIPGEFRQVNSGGLSTRFAFVFRKVGKDSSNPERLVRFVQVVDGYWPKLEGENLKRAMYGVARDDIRNGHLEPEKEILLRISDSPKVVPLESAKDWLEGPFQVTPDETPAAGRGFESQGFDILIASPSDVGAERTGVREEIHAWNDLHGRQVGVMFRASMWELQAAPEMGKRPQASVNRQVVDLADAVIAIFWGKLGTPTGVAESGTIEEIDRLVRVGKRVMIYFCTRPVAAGADQDRESRRVSAYREECMSKGLYAQFGSLEELRSAVSRHLTSLAREIREKATLDKDSGPTEPRARDAWSGLRPLAAVQAVVTIVWKDERHLSNSNNMDYSVLDCDTHAARVRSLGSGRETSIPLGEVSLSQDPKRGNRPKLTLEKWIEEYAI